MGAGKNARERRKHAKGKGVRTRVRPFFLAPIYFLTPPTQASGTLSKNTILLHLIQRAQPSNNFRNLKSKNNKRRGALSSKQNLLHSSCARSLALRTRNIFLLGLTVSANRDKCARICIIYWECHVDKLKARGNSWSAFPAYAWENCRAVLSQQLPKLA